MKRRAAIALCALCLVACQYRVARDPGVMVLNLPSDPSSLNPLTANESAVSEVLSYVMETLADRNPDTLEWRPRLAERWEISPDHLQFTYYLRRDVRWHDGVPFTADDVVYSFERIKDPQVDAAPLRVYYKDLLRAEKIDEHTVRFVYRDPYFMAVEFTAGIPIVPRHIFDDGTDFNKHPAGRRPIGTGPYRFVEWVTSRRIVLERNPEYWRTPPPIDGVVFRIIPERAVTFQALKKGEIDVYSMYPIQWARQSQGKKFLARFAKYRYFPPTMYYIGWNARRPYFTDRRVRRALTLLIDRERLVQRLMYGQAQVVSGPGFPPHPSYDASIAPWPYDPREAAQLLDQAGWIDHDGDGIRDKEGVTFRFTFLYRSGSPMGEALASILREDFLKVGIVVDGQPLEWTTYIKTIDDRSYDAVYAGWGGPVESDPYQIWHSTQTEKGSNHVGFQNAEVDRLIETARREFDPAARAALYRRFHRILHDEQPYTFLFNWPELVAIDRRFTDVRAYALGFDSFEWGVNRNVQLWQ